MGRERGRVRVAPHRQRARADDVAWSPDGRWIAFGSDDLFLVRSNRRGLRKVSDDFVLDLDWSPNGRLLAVAGREIRVLEVATGALRTAVARSGQAVAWSPDGRLLAHADQDGIRTFEIATGRHRVVRTEPIWGAGLAWSPDGRLLAYVQGAPSFYPSMDLRVVDIHGNARTVVSGGATLGGTVADVAWARPPRGVRFRPPAPRSLAGLTATGLAARWPIQRLAADGGRVAFVACGHAFLWTPARRNVEQAEPHASLSPRCNSPTYNAGADVYSLAVDRDRVAFGLIGGGNTKFWWLGGTTVSLDPQGITIAEGSGPAGPAKQDFETDLAGSGSLLIFSSADSEHRQDPCCSVVTSQEILRVDPTGCPCLVIAAEPGPFVPHDVDGGRIAAAGDNAVVLLDGDGTRLLNVLVRARAAQLSGPDLAVAVAVEFRHYDAATGNLRRTWPLPERASLEDAARGLVAYVLDGQVHVLRLSDGADAVVARGTLARFVDVGLVYADGARLHLVPFERLPV